PITITSGELRSLRTRLSSYSNCLNIAYSGIFSYKHYVLRIWIHYKTFIATMTSADFSWLTFFDQALRSLILKFTRLNLSIRSLGVRHRSEEHTSELQSRFDLVCRLLLEKKNKHSSDKQMHQLARPP